MRKTSANKSNHTHTKSISEIQQKEQNTQKRTIIFKKEKKSTERDPPDSFSKEGKTRKTIQQKPKGREFDFKKKR